MIIQSQPDAARRVVTKERDGQLGGLIRWKPEGLDDDAEEIWVDRYASFGWRALCVCVVGGTRDPEHQQEKLLKNVFFLCFLCSIFGRYVLITILWPC